MGFDTYFNEFCDTNGYEGTYGFDKNTNEYHIIFSKGKDNGGAFMSKDELQNMSDTQIKDLLSFIDKEFKLKFAK